MESFLFSMRVLWQRLQIQWYCRQCQHQGCRELTTRQSTQPYIGVDCRPGEPCCSTCGNQHGALMSEVDSCHVCGGDLVSSTAYGVTYMLCGECYAVSLTAPQLVALLEEAHRNGVKEGDWLNAHLPRLDTSDN